jgi:Mg-chelatase subunit ChlD
VKRLTALAFAINVALAIVLASNPQAVCAANVQTDSATTSSSAASPSASPIPASIPSSKETPSASAVGSSSSSSPSSKPGSGPYVEVEETPASQSSLNDLRKQLEGMQREAAATQKPAPASNVAPDNSAPANAGEVQSSRIIDNKNKLLHGSIDQYGEAKQQAFNIGLGMVVKHESDPKLKPQIIRVLPASPAEQGGVHANDRVLKETMDDDLVHLSLQRNGKVIQITLRTGGKAMFDLGPLTASAGQNALQTGASKSALQAGTTKSTLHSGTSSAQLKSNVVEQMRDHDVVMILDMSGSMQTRDCQGLSRWDWVGSQSNDLAVAAEKAASDITVLLFSTGYQLMEHASPSLIPMIFQQVRPYGGTNLSLPLGDALVRYFDARQSNPKVKPLIITIITDGFPNDYDQVRQQIINAANNTGRDGEISITFMLINGQLSGNPQMEQLDSQLGTQRDIVNLVEFDQVLHLGVKQALFEALSGRQLKNVPLSGSSMYQRGNAYPARPTYPGNGVQNYR